jgi:hypothetical protein
MIFYYYDSIFRLNYFLSVAYPNSLIIPFIIFSGLRYKLRGNGICLRHTSAPSQARDYPWLFIVLEEILKCENIYEVA